MSSLYSKEGRAKIQDLSSLIRYNNKLHIHDENVAEHSFYVALYTMELCNKLNIKDKYKLYAIQKALIHDVHEVEVSDIPHNVKAAFPKLLKVCNIAEEDFNLKTFPDFIEEENRLIEENKSIHSFLNEIVNLADVISVLQYASLEVQFNNKSFEEVVKSSVERINESLTLLSSVAYESDLNELRKEIFN